MTQRALRSLRQPLFWRRLAKLNLGLALLGYSIALMLDANVGLGPWNVFTVGITNLIGITFGQATQVIGFVVLAISVFLTRTRPGVGTILNMLIVGPWIDLFRAIPAVPSADVWVWGALQFGVGVVLCGLATGLYITAQLGEGPRDGLSLGVARVFRVSVRVARLGLEVLVLLSGWLMGGPVGIGTVAFAFGIGPMMQFFMRVFREDAAPPLNPSTEGAAGADATAGARARPKARTEAPSTRLPLWRPRRPRG